MTQYSHVQCFPSYPESHKLLSIKEIYQAETILSKDDLKYIYEAIEEMHKGEKVKKEGEGKKSKPNKKHT